ncbi:AGAP012370-PA, partial [Anopheles gambiae str. PEST]
RIGGHGHIENQLTDVEFAAGRETRSLHAHFVAVCRPEQAALEFHLVGSDSRSWAFQTPLWIVSVWCSGTLDYVKPKRV